MTDKNIPKYPSNVADKSFQFGLTELINSIFFFLDQFLAIFP